MDYSKWDKIDESSEDEAENAEPASVVTLAEEACAARGRRVKGAGCGAGELNDTQARDWMFRAGVDGPETWARLWQLIALEDDGKQKWVREAPGAAGRVPCPPCQCLSETCAGTVSAGRVAHEAVTCWRCKSYFDSRCVSGFEAATAETSVVSVESKAGVRHMAVELDELHVRLEAGKRATVVNKQATFLEDKGVKTRRNKVPTDARRDVGLLCGWGECPRCGAELGASCLPKLAVAPVARKVFDSSPKETDRDVLRRCFLIEAGYCLRRAYEALLWDKDAVEHCTRAIVVLNLARSFEPDVFRGPVADLFFRAHYARSCLEGGPDLKPRFLDYARYEDVGGSFEATFLTRSQLVGRVIGALEGIPGRYESANEPLDGWFPERDPEFDKLLDSETRSAKLWRARKKDPADVGVETKGLAVLTLALDARWLLHSKNAATIYFDHVLVNTRVYDDIDDERLPRAVLCYGRPDFVPVMRPLSDNGPRPAAIAGADRALVFRSSHVVDMCLTYNCLFQVNRVCAQLYVLVELKHDQPDPAIDLGVLALAAAAVSNTRRFLDDSKSNRLLPDWPPSLLPK